jgi:TolA-binding protein
MLLFTERYLNKSVWVKLIVISITSLVLLACQSTKQESSPARKTLADLAGEQSTIEIDSITLSRAQRANKLTALYQTILTLEPNAEVRAQIAYRLVQINTQAYENIEDTIDTDPQGMKKSEEALNTLVLSFQDLITRFPERSDNEWMQYQLAKALDLQGKSKESLLQMEALLAQFPNSKYAAELHFRRGDIYYNFQAYPAALIAYKSASTAVNNQPYYVNSRYMSAWVLFKLNRLPEADSEFISLLEYIVVQESQQLTQADFSFEKLDNRYTSLIADVQRVLSISLSQQQQSQTLVALTKQQGLTNLNLYRHILFENLAGFLIRNGLKYDAELTYQAYIDIAPNTIWAARYSLALMNLLQDQGKYQASLTLEQTYVKKFGLQSVFWQKAHAANAGEALTKYEIDGEILPNLLNFSYQQSRRLYASAQRLTEKNKRRLAFVSTAKALATYLELAKLPQANYLQNKPKTSKGLLADELLFADANFEAEQYEEALKTYQLIAYEKELIITLASHKAQTKLILHNRPVPLQKKYATANNAADKLRLEAAYATTLTVRTLLKIAGVKATDNVNTSSLTTEQKVLLLTRNRLDQLFVANYPKDIRGLTLATQAVEYAFSAKNYQSVKYYSDFILHTHLTDFNLLAPQIKPTTTPNVLSKKALKQVQIASQLWANSLYQQKYYKDAESAYQLALTYVANKNRAQTKKRKEMRELLASCIYFQAQGLVKEQPLLAVNEYLRVGKVIPESKYRLTAEFDAGNILLAQKQFKKGIEVLTAFKVRYPTHEYSRSISAKLAKAYESTEQWELAATQLLAMINGPEAAKFSTELKREAQYTAAEYYQKAGNIDKALTSFRTYAHKYPQPFVVAQEVRLKLGNFYQQKKETNKQYFWYRKIVKSHDAQVRKSSGSLSARAEYLASFAALGLGEAHQKTFTWTKLKLPLNKSLKRKQSAMKLAIEYYQKVLSYQLAEFVPQASFNLATMYRLLAKDIMSSQRPGDLDELALEEYELLLEDIAFPFEEKSIEIHTNNAQRAWQNVFDAWVIKSFGALAELDPAQYNKQERVSHAIQAIY